MLERLRVWFWILRNYPLLKYASWKTKATRSRLCIMTSEDTVDYIIQNKASIARFGDGELQMVSHYINQGTKDNFGVDTFQDYNETLAKRLHDILVDNEATPQNLLVALPYQLKKSGISDAFNELFWDREWLARRSFLEKYALDRCLGDTNFTRFYMGRRDIADYPKYIAMLKQIWMGRKLLIVEGEMSRLGVGNDLFATAQSIERVICPKTNAFARYDDILTEVKARVSDDTLIILALGHTATVLAYDLATLGYQALDLGHIDVEYEWYRMGAKRKVAIPNKYVNEAPKGRIQGTSLADQQYNGEIVARIL